MHRVQSTSQWLNMRLKASQKIPLEDEFKGSPLIRHPSRMIFSFKHAAVFSNWRLIPIITVLGRVTKDHTGPALSNTNELGETDRTPVEV
ncbi:hypothetical protein AVEN_143666-1 [Araneus ventricosus]|uniref:Uncharacterized protein n=1 Tax=Araneus ventricosus TaxID=182803 RepID=A0A4Y2ANI2_ARAVE|nr:hypothetical protein AVEN_143666-1 [Araneus ventricosus]